MSLADSLPGGTGFDLLLDHMVRLCLTDEESSEDDLGDVLLHCMARVGRNDSPAFLFDLWSGGHLSHLPDVTAVGIEDAWTSAEYPTKAFDPMSLWVQMFEEVGYLVGCRRAESQRPTEPVRLYRGAPPEGKAGMSWTSSRTVAEQFAAGGLRGRPQGTVWTALVDPARLLAHFPGSRDEDEYVINPDGLPIVADNEKGGK